MTRKGLCATVSAAAAITAAAGAQSLYHVTNAGPAQLNSIGDGGTAEGVGSLTGKAVAWNRAYGLVDIPPIYQGNSEAHSFGVNAPGQVVGWSYTQGAGKHAFVWDPVNGTRRFQDFGPVGDEASGINTQGHIVGRYYIPTTGQYDSFLWRGPGDYLVLGRLNPDYGTQALAVNDGDWTVGWAVYVPFDIRGVIWAPDGSVQELGNPQGQTANDPVDVSNDGSVACVTFGQLGPTVGFLRHADGSFEQVLNPVWPGAQTYPRGMNNSDALAGDMYVAPNTDKAFVWTHERGALVLNDWLDHASQGWDIVYAGDINDHGQVCGLGRFEGQLYGVVLDPVLVPVAPSAVTVSLGRLDAGSAASLAIVDGDALRVCRFLVPNLLVAPVDVRIDGTFSSGNCLGVTLRVVSRMQQAGAFGQTLELWNWITGGWDDKDFRTDPVGPSWQTVDLVADGDTRRLLRSDGSLRAQYRVRQTGPAATALWCHEADQAVWLVAP